ncbi:hypothetical protein ACOSP7_030900 [Xanthoceras sorbifolium]
MEADVPVKGECYGPWLYVSYKKIWKRGGGHTSNVARVPSNANNTKTHGPLKTQANNVKLPNSKDGKSRGYPKSNRGDNAGTSVMAKSGVVAPSSKVTKKIMSGIATGVNIKEETMKKKKGGGKNKGKIPLAIHPVPIDVMEETSVLQQLHRDVITAKNREKVLSEGQCLSLGLMVFKDPPPSTAKILSEDMLDLASARQFSAV